MKKSYLIQKLREAIRMQILKDKPLMEAEKIATGREEEEQEDKTIVDEPAEKEKQIGPDTEVGSIQTVVPPDAGTVTAVNNAILNPSGPTVVSVTMPDGVTIGALQTVAQVVAGA